ncbi:MAG TPA: hypothetical protein VJW55_10970 [Candidatus Angelobacter sp.]|nr:hypothetical protein [Candidatus Angelobacter sp.]
MKLWNSRGRLFHTGIQLIDQTKPPTILAGGGATKLLIGEGKR